MDLFISYARSDRARVKTLAQSLETRGFSVWWDRRLRGGDDFSKEIERALEQADAVLVCWSASANMSRWVKDEASLAADANKLITTSLDGAGPPIGFRQFHCIDLSRWNGGPDHALFHELVESVTRKRDDPAAALPAETLAPPVRESRHRGIFLILSLVLLALGVVGAWRWATERTPEPAAGAMADTLRRYDLLLPEHAPLDFIGSSPLSVPLPAMAITPDGETMVYVGAASDAGSVLYQRRLDAFDVKRLPGTEGAYRPFISPDGRKVAFFANDELRVTALDGGSTRTVLATPNPRGGAWVNDDRILYSDREGQEHWTVELGSGDRQPVVLAEATTPDGRQVQFNAEFWPMPGNRYLLAPVRFGQTTDTELVRFDPFSGERETVMTPARWAQAAHGALLYQERNELFALSFDAETLNVSGDPRRLADSVRLDQNVPQVAFSDDTLIYATGAPFGERTVSRITPDWTLEDTVLAPGRIGPLSVSPDGREIAFTQLGNEVDIWVIDRDTAQRRRITRGGQSHHPFWSADGQWLYYHHDPVDSSPAGIYRSSARAADFQRTLVYATAAHIDAVGPDDVATLVGGDPGEQDVLLLDLTSGLASAVADRPGVVENLGQVSPNGRWLAYTSDASGRYEIIVKPLATEGAPVQVSIEGGEEPLWSDDMRFLFYRYGTRLFRVPVQAGDDALAFGTPEVVLDEPTWRNVGGYSYWPDHRGGGFLILRVDQPRTTRALRVIEGWRAILAGEG